MIHVKYYTLGCTIKNINSGGQPIIHRSGLSKILPEDEVGENYRIKIPCDFLYFVLFPFVMYKYKRKQTPVSRNIRGERHGRIPGL